MTTREDYTSFRASDDPLKDLTDLRGRLHGPLISRVDNVDRDDDSRSKRGVTWSSAPYGRRSAVKIGNRSKSLEVSGTSVDGP